MKIGQQLWQTKKKVYKMNLNNLFSVLSHLGKHNREKPARKSEAMRHNINVKKGREREGTEHKEQPHHLGSAK